MDIGKTEFKNTIIEEDVADKKYKNKYGGEVILKNVGPEYAKKIKVIMEEHLDEEVAEKYTNSAVGTLQQKDGWYVVRVDFNASGSAKVVEMRKAGDQKLFATDAFKLLVDELDLI